MDLIVVVVDRPSIWHQSSYYITDSIMLDLVSLWLNNDIVALSDAILDYYNDVIDYEIDITFNQFLDDVLKFYSDNFIMLSHYRVSLDLIKFNYKVMYIAEHKTANLITITKL